MQAKLAEMLNGLMLSMNQHAIYVIAENDRANVTVNDRHDSALVPEDM